MGKLKRLLRFLYEKLFLIHDTPQKISLGFAIGVFSGVTPGIGPLTALFLAFLLRANRASALVGTLFTNTWLSLVIFVLSIKAGSVILGVEWQAVYQKWLELLKDFRFSRLFEASVVDILLPIAVGYLVSALCFGFVAYIVARAILLFTRHESKDRTHIPGRT